jgi:hypothetical protein
MRIDASSVSAPSEASMTALRKYFTQLLKMDGRFPFSQTAGIKLGFQWYICVFFFVFAHYFFFKYKGMMYSILLRKCAIIH